MRGSSAPPGLPGAGQPLRATRRILPPSERGFWGTVPVAASPVPTHRKPLGSKRGRQPEWRPSSPAVFTGMPVTMSARSVSVVKPGLTFQRTTRTSPLGPPSVEAMHT